MFSKVSTAAILLSGLFVASNASATDVPLEEFVGTMISQAVAATKQELHNNVQEAVLTAHHFIGMEEAEEFATKVTISDIETAEDDDAAE